jgi:hypothetical protein
MGGIPKKSGEKETTVQQIQKLKQSQGKTIWRPEYRILVCDEILNFSFWAFNSGFFS